MVSFREAHGGWGEAEMKAAWLVGVVAMGLLGGCGSQGGAEDGGAGGSSATGTSSFGAGIGGNGGAGVRGEPRPDITTSTSSPDAGTQPGPSAGAHPGTPADGAAAPTFTQIFDGTLTVFCSGASCHSPGIQGGIGFATRSTAYSAVRSRVMPGDSEDSSFFLTVNSGTMPPGGPRLSETTLANLRAWIDAGALDD
jgi:hypothetical protein